MEPYFIGGTKGLDNFLGRVVGGVETSGVFIKDNGSGFGNGVFGGDVFFHADNSIFGKPLARVDLLFESFCIIRFNSGYGVNKGKLNEMFVGMDLAFTHY